MADDPAPPPRRPLTPVVSRGGMIFCSGQVPMIEGRIVSDDPEEQTRQVLRNIDALLAQEGATLRDVVKCTCIVRHDEHLEPFNRAYAAFFEEQGAPFPARTTMVAGPPNPAVLVEIEAIAVAGGSAGV